MADRGSYLKPGYIWGLYRTDAFGVQSLIMMDLDYEQLHKTRVSLRKRFPSCQYDMKQVELEPVPSDLIFQFDLEVARIACILNPPETTVEGDTDA